MKVAVTSKGQTLDDQVDPRFGRCAYFLVVDLETMNVESLENTNASLGGGAGIQSAQMIANSGVTVLLTGNCGPNAFQTMSAAEIEVIVGASGKVRDAIEEFKSGSLSSTQSPNVADHFGIGDDTYAPSGAGTQFPGGQMGTGRGMGGGRGMGMGRGMGQGMGMGRGMARQDYSGQGGKNGNTAGSTQTSGNSELDALKDQAKQMEQQLKSINENISQVEKGAATGRIIAVVNSEKCTTCGGCESVCPTGAITMEAIAVIDHEKCTGCGICVTECPPGAITLKNA